MFRGSRLVASFLLVLTGLATSALAVFVLPNAVEDAAGRWLIVAALTYATLHFVALVGVALARDWGRNLAVLVAEVGGALAIVSGVAVVTGAEPLGVAPTAAPGLVAWVLVVYAVLGIAAGRVPEVRRLSTIERRRLVVGPSFAGIAS